MISSLPRSIALRWALATAALAAIVLLAVVDPATSPLFPPCLFRKMTGWLCPGCGSARAIHALLHGDVVSALGFNPLAVAAVPALAIDVSQRVRGLVPWTQRLSFAYVIGLIAAFVLFGVLRNVW